MEGEYEFVAAGEAKEPALDAEILIYCERCDRTQPLVITRMTEDDNKISGHLLCAVCGFVVVTLIVPTSGEYQFLKSAELP
jgi:hypothetical protein